MELKVYLPPDKELPFDSIRLAYTSLAESRIVTTPPFGKPVIIFFINPGSVKNYNSTLNGVLLGQHTQPLMLDLNENYKVMAIHLKPYALKELLNLDASQLTNKYIPINGLALIEQLYQLVIKHIDEEGLLINEINSFFKTAPRYPVSYEVLTFLKHLQVHSAEPIGQLVKAIGLTERNLERKFKTEVGISPKKYLQICRVFGVFETLKDDTDWQRLVVDYNYTDQAHLIKEFKKYTNVAPGLYVRKGLSMARQLPPLSAFGQ